ELYQRFGVDLLSPALRVTAARALVAVLDADQGGLSAFRALRHAPRLAGQVGDRALLDQGLVLLARRHKADIDHVLLDHIADRGEQRGHVTAAHPRAAARIEHGLHLLHHEGDVAAAAEHRGDHAGQADGPGVMLHALRVDEDLEGPAATVLHDVVDG